MSQADNNMSGYATLTQPTELNLPAGWVTAQLGEYLYLKNGFAFKSNSYVEKNEQTVPVIRISDIYGKLALDNRASHVSVKNSAEGFEIRKGDLLIAMSGATTGKVGVYAGTEPAYQNQRVGNIKLHSDYLGSAGFRNHLISSLTTDILKIAYGGAQPNISGKAIEEIVIAFPPLAEQQQIAAKLDELLAQVDTLKTRLDTIPKILKRFRQSVLAATVNGRLTEDWRGTKPLGSVVTIGEVASDIRYGTSKKCDYETGNIPVIRIPNIDNGFLNLTDLKFADFDEKELKNLSLVVGDLLLIRSNGSVDLVGKTALITEKDVHCLYAGYLIRIRLNQQMVMPKYLLYCLQSLQIRKVIEIQARSTSGVNNINSKELAALKFLLPHLEEQTEIVARAEQLFTYADQIEQRVKDAQARVNHLTQSILAKAFRGELTADWRAQNPELISGDNSAEALLAKIKVERESYRTKKNTRLVKV